jgi:hypothetical protein
MKRVAVMLLTIVLVLGLAGCGEEKEVDLSKMTAEEIVQLYKDCGFPISEVVTYTKDTDPNEQLGKPGMYTSKAVGADTRVKQDPDIVGYVGLNIEVFENKVDAEKRKEYLDSLTGMLQAHTDSVLCGNVLIRVDTALSQEQADQYIEAAKLMYEEGKKPKYVESKKDKKAKEAEDNGVIGDYQIKDISAEKGSDFEGNPCIIITYTFVNNGSTAVSIYDALYITAKQSGVDIDTAILADLDYSANADVITSGSEKQFKQAFVPVDESKITVNFRDGNDFDSKGITKEFEL